MVYSEAKLESNGGKAFPYFRPFRIRKVSDKRLPIRILLQVSIKYNAMSQTSFTGAPYSMRILYNVFLLSKSQIS
jgi:hypothetical protein